MYGARLRVRGDSILHVACAQGARVRAQDQLTVQFGLWIHLGEPHLRRHALHLAAFAGRKKLVEALPKGADPNAYRCVCVYLERDPKRRRSALTGR